MGSIRLETGGAGEDDDSSYASPQRGQPPCFYWPSNSKLLADHVIAGSFNSAALLLNNQLGVTQIEPFKHLFLSLFARSKVTYNSLPLFPPNFVYPLRNWQEATPKTSYPAISLRLNDLAEKLQLCYQLTTNGKFAEAITKLRQIILSVPLLVVSSKQEVAEAQQLIQIFREYLVGLLLEAARKELPRESLDDAKRNLEMAAYFTHCELQPIHKVLTLRTAANLSFKSKQMKACASFCRRCIELGPKPDIATQMRKMLTAAERENTNAFELNYDEHNPFVICSRKFIPLYRGKPQTKCPFCGASFSSNLTGEICDVCQVAEIGREAEGLQINLLKGNK